MSRGRRRRPVEAAAQERASIRMSAELLRAETCPLTPEEAWRRYAPPRTLGATEEHQLAMDEHLKKCGFQSLISHAIGLGMGFEEVAPQFLGYAYLGGLSQDGLIRAGVTTVAEEMTKRWVEISRSGAITDANKDGVDDRVKALTAAMKDFGLQDLFNEAAQKCDFDGGCLIYIDTGERDDMILRQPLRLDPAQLRGRVRRFTLVEAINLYPGLYNASDPLSPNYYRPDTWMVLGKEIHRSRFLYFAPNKLPMILRPSYNFFGIPAAQLALDYVGHFTKSREAAQRLLTKFSLTVFKSNLNGLFSGGNCAVKAAGNLNYRLQYLAQHRDNDSILLIDKESEDVVKLDTSLGGVVDVVRQALEFVAAIFRLPVVKLLGISPAGMNATGEFDDRNFLEHIASKQEKILRNPLEHVFRVLQMHLFGEIDPTLSVDFAPLSDDDDAAQASVLKTEAERDALYIDRGVLDQTEVRQRLSDDPDSGYSFILPEEVPQEPETEGLLQNPGAALANSVHESTAMTPNQGGSANG